MRITTEYSFVLPRGYVGSDGTVHRRGIMRLATARDEIEPLRDPRVQSPDDPYLTIIVLSRVIAQLGTLGAVTPREIEGLFAADLAFLQDLYGVVNFGSPDDVYEFLQSSGGSLGSSTPETPAAPAAPEVSDITDEDDSAEAAAPELGRRARSGAFVEEVKRPD